MTAATPTPGYLKKLGALALLLGLTGVAGIPRTLAAQYPRAQPGEFEVRGFDFRPQGAWRREVQQIRRARRALLRGGNLTALNLPAPGVRVAGAFSVPVLPIGFRNFPGPFPAAAYQDVLFSPAPVGVPYSVGTFYQQLSNGNITISGLVRDWVTADSNDTYYEDGCNGIGVLTACPHGGIRLGQLLLEALIKNDDGILDWGQFDSDGPDGIPNSGDDDGVVDFVLFLQPEVDGACKTSNLWAHRFVISGWNGGQPYVTKTPWQGHPGQFIRVDDYTLQSGQGGRTACTAGEIMPIGTVSHETGHAFGLPDLYDTDLRNPNHTEGIGEWGLMGSGNYALPWSPARFEAWSLAELGWVTLDTLGPSRTVRLAPVTSSDTVLYAGVPGTDEYFLLENRQALESDSAQMNPVNYAGNTKRFAKMPGLLVWHIDQGQVDAFGFSAGNRVNVGPVQGVALVQADGLNQLRTPALGNRGDAGDPYPGSGVNRKLSATTIPALLDNQGRFGGFSIDSIYQLPGGTLVFRYLNRPRSVVAAGSAGASVRVNGAAYARFDDIVAPGDTLALDADSLAVGNGGRSRFRFLSWSDGQPRSHALVEGATPDTVLASFAAEHRLLVTASGGGTVSASVPGNYSAGLFLPAYGPVTLTATAPSNLVFSSWGGDTTATAPVLTLPMDRPFDVTATFTTAVAVTLTEAVNGIFSIAPLSSAQRTFLDQVGNRNGRYDVGDFLAYLQLTGVSPSSPAVHAALTGATRSRPSPATAARP